MALESGAQVGAPLLLAAGDHDHDVWVLTPGDLQVTQVDICQVR